MRPSGRPESRHTIGGKEGTWSRTRKNKLSSLRLLNPDCQEKAQFVIHNDSRVSSLPAICSSLVVV